MKQLDAVLITLAAAPDGEIDKKILPKIHDLIGKTEEEVAMGLLAIIGECGVYNLASDFAMIALNQTYATVNAVVEARKKRNEQD